MDANPNCTLCGGSGRITHEQAGLAPRDPSDVLGRLGGVACFRCWFGLDEEKPAPAIDPRDAEIAAAEGALRTLRGVLRRVTDELAREALPGEAHEATARRVVAELAALRARNAALEAYVSTERALRVAENAEAGAADALQDAERAHARGSLPLAAYRAAREAQRVACERRIAAEGAHHMADAALAALDAKGGGDADAR